MSFMAWFLRPADSPSSSALGFGEGKRSRFVANEAGFSGDAFENLADFRLIIRE
jgi:hypothetical protein